MHNQEIRIFEHISQPFLTFYSDNVRMTLLCERLEQAMAEATPPIKAAALARIIDVSKATMSDWLSGKTRDMKGQYLIKTCKALNVRPEWLATGAPPMRPETHQLSYPAKATYTNSSPPIGIGTSGIPPEAVIRIMRIVTEGIGIEKFNDYPESEKKRIIKLLQTAILDEESVGLSDNFILKMVGME